MNSNKLVLRGLAGAALLFAGEAFPHTFGASGAGFLHGLAHPYRGLDHLLAMIAVGLWASQLGGAYRWRVPAAFVSMITMGAWLAGLGGTPVSMAAPIAFSVLTLGILVALSIRMPAIWSVFLVSTFAVFHGYAHGLEMPQAADPWGYGSGFILATASLHALGLALGAGLQRRPCLLRSGGAAIVIIGGYLLAAG